MTGGWVRPAIPLRHLELSEVIGPDVGHSASAMGNPAKRGRYLMGGANITADYQSGRLHYKAKLQGKARAVVNLKQFRNW
jgi:hypothetical protein